VTGLSVSGITIDAADPGRLAAWWAEALGWRLDGHCCVPPEGTHIRLEFMAVREPKRVKNRVHVDFGAHDVAVTLDRLVSLGATVAWEEDFGADAVYRNVVLRDPEGNEFCVGGPPDAASPPETPR
jgi:predicted enzyme related to lactoylglutathione lyase